MTWLVWWTARAYLHENTSNHYHLESNGQATYMKTTHYLSHTHTHTHTHIGVQSRRMSPHTSLVENMAKKEPQSFFHCSSFDHHAKQSLNNCIFVFLDLPTDTSCILGLVIYLSTGITRPKHLILQSQNEK